MRFPHWRVSAFGLSLGVAAGALLSQPSARKGIADVLDTPKPPTSVAATPSPDKPSVRKENAASPTPDEAPLPPLIAGLVDSARDKPPASTGNVAPPTPDEPSTSASVDYVKCQAMQSTAEDVFAQGGGRQLMIQELWGNMGKRGYTNDAELWQRVMERPDFAPIANKIRKIFAEMDAAGCP